MATEVTIKTNKVTAVQNKLTTAMKAATNLVNALSTIDKETLKMIVEDEVERIDSYYYTARDVKSWSYNMLDAVAFFNLRK